MINTELKTIHANGLNYAYYEQGEGDKLVFCFHGFPDTPHTWEHLMPQLVDAGYRVIAPYIRGYSPTEAPADNRYTADELGADVLSLLDAFGAEKAYLVGHDWGSSFVYSAAALAPERINKMVTITSPHMRAIKWGPKTIWNVRHIFTFQRRKSARNWMKQDNYANIATLFRRWSPNWQFTDKDIEPVRQSFSQAGGLDGALGYYWSFMSLSDSKGRALLRKKPSVPTLLLLGEADGCFPPQQLNSFDNVFDAPYKVVTIPNVGHFLHREVPDQVAEYVLTFFET